MLLALIDIDGTIADCSHRIGHIRGGEAPNWEAFFDAMVDDKPIQPVINFVNVLSNTYFIQYITGRPNSHRSQTIDWLIQHRLPMGPVFMRPTGDHRPDYEVKKEIFKSTIKHADLVIEDRKQVVDMWRSLGILTLQPKDGDY